MLEKLKKLSYVSVKEADDLEKINLLFIAENNNGVYTKTVCSGSFQIDDLENIPEAVEKFFINRIKDIVKDVNVIKSEDIKKNINDFFETLKPINDKFHNTDKFIMISSSYFTDSSKGIIIDFNDIPVVISEYLDNEIICGYKTKIEQPGIIVITNEDGLSDKNNVKIAITDIGFYPENAYYRLKIN